MSKNKLPLIKMEPLYLGPHVKIIYVDKDYEPPQVVDPVTKTDIKFGSKKHYKLLFSGSLPITLEELLFYNNYGFFTEDQVGELIQKRKLNLSSSSSTKLNKQIPKKRETSTMNPPLVIEDIVVKGTNGAKATAAAKSVKDAKAPRTFHVIRDDYLPGGTKQRAMFKILSESPCEEFIYAGPAEGFAQIALSYTAQQLGKKATLFLAKQKERTDLTKRALTYKPHLVEVDSPIRGKPAPLKLVQQKAQDYVTDDEKQCLLPFGLFSEEYIDILSDQLMAASEGADIPETANIWLVGGSGTILHSLYKLYPHAHFNVVQVGKEFHTIDDRKQWSRENKMPLSLEATYNPENTTLYISKKKFWELASPLPPYPSVKTYDAKLWEFALKHGKDGDYIWNVAKD